jgi:hypothetical protein
MLEALGRDLLGSVLLMCGPVMAVRVSACSTQLGLNTEGNPTLWGTFIAAVTPEPSSSSAGGESAGSTGRKRRRPASEAANKFMPPRASRRLQTTPKERYRHAWQVMQQRTESAHLEIVTMAQDRKPGPLTKALLRRALHLQRPVDVNRVNQAFNATVLMDVVKARGVTEQQILGICKELLETFGSDPNVGSIEGLTPLMIAAARGLPRLVEYLLSKGADPTAQGKGSFRAHEGRKAVTGTFSPAAWVDAMLVLEESLGVLPVYQKSLRRAKEVLRGWPSGSGGGGSASFQAAAT